MNLNQALLNSRRLRILLIDDDEDDSYMFKRLLSEVPDLDWELEWAPSYDEGIACVRRGNYEVVFLDYRLGIHTGLDLLREAISEHCRIPMVLLTGYGEKEVDQAAMTAGAADYLIKDQISPSTIERCIRYSIHRAQTLEALRQQEAQVLVQDRLASVGLLASSLAHEIGTPLGVIRGRAEYLSLQIKDDAIRKNAEVIISQIDRVSALIRSLLNLARGDESRRTGQVHVNQVVAEVLDLMAHEARKHDIEIRNEITEVIPVRITADASSLHQVLLNLLVNSIHAINEAVLKGRKETFWIRLSVETRGEFWSLNVADNGCGISETNLRNLFKPFFTTKDIGVGTGLGLVTSYRIVEAWGGSIRVESKEGVGTTFRVLLPKEKAI